MVEDMPKILIVEDDVDIADMLNAYFRVQGYEVYTVNWGEDGVRNALTILPDLMILDIRLPDIDGFEVAERLRSNRKTHSIPIIFLTEKRERIDRLRGLELGADDYVTKPFDVQELRIRVRNALQRSNQSSLTNPVTGLPEGKLVDEQLEHSLEKRDWAMLIISLDGLDSFREAYGFVASDDVLRAVNVMIQNAIRESSTLGSFLGQLGATDFVIILQASDVAPIEQRIQTRLEQSLDYFYPIRDQHALPESKRLSIRIGKLQANQGPFESLDDMKANLLRTRGK